MSNAKYILVVILLLIASLPLQAEDGIYSWLLSVERNKEVAPVIDEVFLEECGSCHFPYQPGLLPENSWKKVIAAEALEDHFGDDASLDEETRLQIEYFLVANSADKSDYKRSKKIMASLKAGEAPLRISEVRFFRRKHHELEDKHVRNNKDVRSFSNCDKCHRKAKEAIFDDSTVEIPNFGKWTL